MIKLRRSLEFCAFVLLGICTIQLLVTNGVTLVFGLLIMIITFKWPVLGVVAMILSTSSIMQHDFIRLSVGGGYQITPADAILATLVLSCASRRAVGLSLRSPFTRPLVVVLSVVALVALQSLLRFDIAPGIVLAAGRAYLYYAVFFLILGLISNPAHVRFLVTALLVIGTVVSFLMVCQAFIGPETRLFLGGQSVVRLHFSSGGSVRFIPPGVYVLIFCFFYCISRASVGKQLGNKRTMLLIATICSIGLTLSMTRIVWLGCILALASTPVFFHRIHTVRIIRSVFTVAASLLLIVVLSLIILWQTGHHRAGMFQAATDRFFSIFEKDEYQAGSSVHYRWQEYEDMKPYLQKYIVSGFGFGNPYRLFWNPQTHNYELSGYYVHNGALAILLPMGLGGLAAFLWLFYSVLRYFRVKMRQVNEPFTKSLVLSTVYTVIALIVSLMTQPSLSDVPAVPVIALILGLTVVTVRRAEPIPQNASVYRLTNVPWEQPLVGAGLPRKVGAR